jgi:2,4-dienoyl-CoA reductase-like NADH-dependent reductase (Old Yellow Enzyme family)
MTDEDIADAIEGFANAAKLALGSAGFDGVEIHGANGYLLDHFLTDYTNQRTDCWGGNVRNRVTLILEVIKAVRAAVGGARVGVRVSQGKVNDYAHKWAEDEAGAYTIYGSLADAGINYIHVTEHKAWKPAFSDSGPNLVSLARCYAPGVATVANG